MKTHMTTSQFFVYRRPVAWVALVTTLAWGAFAYTLMPQRQDPIIPVRSGVILTAGFGLFAERISPSAPDIVIVLGAMAVAVVALRLQRQQRDEV